MQEVSSSGPVANTPPPTTSIELIEQVFSGPTEILRPIFEQLSSFRDVAALACTNVRLQSVSHMPELWSRTYAVRLGVIGYDINTPEMHVLHQVKYLRDVARALHPDAPDHLDMQLLKQVDESVCLGEKRLGVFEGGPLHTRIMGAETAVAVIPRSISLCVGLTSISLWNCGIEYVDPAIGSLSALTILDLTQNKIRRLPATLEQLTNLTTLIVCYNELTELGFRIPAGSKLKKVRIQKNPIEFLPTALKALKTLVSLKCDSGVEFRDDEASTAPANKQVVHPSEAMPVDG